MGNIRVFGKEIIDENAIQQLRNCVLEGEMGVLTADAHYGYGHPIGGVVASKNRISISGVGFDIACGNKAVRTNLQVGEVDIPKIMDEIFKRISFGVGKVNKEPADHEIIDRIANAEFKGQRDFLDLAQQQLGSIGSGNHFVDLFKDDEDALWIAVHFGSRGFGHKTASGFMSLAKGGKFDEHFKSGSMDAPPITLAIESELGQAYIEAMHLAGDYAYAGRNLVVDKVLEILGAETEYQVHNHHNFAWKEEHYGEKYWVVRKGCTPAFPNQQGFVGANMSDTSVIVEGTDTQLAKESLYSTVHGAGRVMSRRSAIGKVKWQRKGDKRQKVILSKGKVDYDEVVQRMRSRNIELRGGGADEAPECYKKLDEVLDQMGNSIKVLKKLYPVGVAMSP